jgi:hypothetical protein
MPAEMYEYSLWCKAKAQARVKEKHTTTTSSATANNTTNDEGYDNNNSSDNADASLVNDVDTDDSDINNDNDNDDDSIHSDDDSHDTAATAISNKRQRTDDNSNAAGQSTSTTTISSSTGGIVIDEYTAIAYSREGSQVGNRIDLRRVSTTIYTYTYYIHKYMQTYDASQHECVHICCAITFRINICSSYYKLIDTSVSTELLHVTLLPLTGFCR